MRYLIIISLMFFSLNVCAQTPHQFQSGDPVSASKINENFEYASKRLYLKSDGLVIGTILELAGGSSNNYSFLVTSKGYFYLGLKSPLPGPPTLGNEVNMYYSSSDCSGTAYVNDAPGVNRVYFVDSYTYYISGETGATSNVTYNSYRNGSGSCLQSSSAGSSRYPLTVNDESVTGFPSTTGTLSISYE